MSDKSKETASLKKELQTPKIIYQGSSQIIQEDTYEDSQSPLNNMNHDASKQQKAEGVSIYQVYNEVQDIMAKKSNTQQSLSPSKYEDNKVLKSIQSSYGQKVKLLPQNQEQYTPDYQKSSNQLKTNQVTQKELGSDKDKVIEKLTQLNEQYKDKMLKLSQALDFALINNRPNQQLLQPVIEAPVQQQQQYVPTREATSNLLKLREKEINSLMNTIGFLKKENAALKVKLEHKEGFHKMAELEEKLKESERKNAELQKEVKSIQRIQHGQGKALERITNETDNPAKVKTLSEELRIAKERIKELDEKCKRDEKNSIQVQEYMIKLEESCRDLKQKLKSKQALNNIVGQNSTDDTIQNVESQIPAVDPKFEELQRANKILMRAKEAQFKKGQYLKYKFEKIFTKMKAQNELLMSQVAEKDKEIKLYQIKMTDFIKSNLNTISSQSYVEIENLISPKPVNTVGNSSNRMTEGYIKMKEIQHKYGKLPLKPGFQNGRSIRLQHLSIDVNGNDYGLNNSELNITNTASKKASGNLQNPKSTTNNRSKSTDPTAKKLARLPETTKRFKPTKQLLNDDSVTDIAMAQEDVRAFGSDKKPVSRQRIKDIYDIRVHETEPNSIRERDLDRETQELLDRIQIEDLNYMDKTDTIINDGLDYEYFNAIEGDISKINHELHEESNFQ